MSFRTPALRTALLTGVAVITLTGCGGTKVYDTSKTIVYKGTIYQVTDVKQISTTVEAVTSDEQTINLKNREKDDIEGLIEANDPLFVRMAFQLDDQELVYAADTVDSWRDYNRLLGRFEDANDDIADLMAEEKTEQLELR